MDGVLFARWIEQELAARGISKGEFYAAVGISATAMYGWRKGSEPKRESVESIEKYFGSSFSNYEEEDETDDFLQLMREDYSFRALCESAKPLTKEQRLTVAAYIERLKSGGT